MARFSRWIDKEWLLTNGLGSYMSSTPIGLNTRRYHGLFVAALTPPVDRYVLLSKCEESLISGDRQWNLGCNEYPDVIHPTGYEWMVDFTLDPLPRATYVIDDICLEKQWLMIHGQQIAMIRYFIRESAQPVSLELHPLVAGRDYHHLLRESAAHVKRMDVADQSVSLILADRIALHLHSDRAHFVAQPDWYRNFRYRMEAYRGLDFEEDLFAPGIFRCELSAGQSCTLVASLKPVEAVSFEEARQLEIDRRRALVPVGWDAISARLAVAADAFIVRRGEGRYTVLAGYPWFTDWGRDTMIALPGLTLVTGRYEIARRILETFAGYCRQGMLPNRFPDSGDEPEYNTVDGTLWFFWAIHKYLEYTGDWDFVGRLWPTLIEIIDWHVRGTRYGIRMDQDGFLLAGDEDTQLTWMDAKIGDKAVTPRSGKAVEINALWYNALRICEQIAQRLAGKPEAAHYCQLAMSVHENFEKTFWNPETGCLYDTVNETSSDASIRPNQLLALSLPYPLLSVDRAKEVIHVVERELLTPMGLRSLSPSSADYVGSYGGSFSERDGAYHQGTVWVWLIGPFITAMTYAYGRNPATRDRGTAILQRLVAHLDEAGLGTVSEIADGDPPHTPRGCYAQAWSVAELLRILREELISCGGNLV